MSLRDQKELFAVEDSHGEWIDAGDNGGFSVFTTIAEAHDALDAETESGDNDAITYKIIRFMREPVTASESRGDES